MATKTRTELKAYFETGDKPTQAQFEDFINGVPNTEDDKLTYKECALKAIYDGSGGVTVTILADAIGTVSMANISTGIYQFTSTEKFTGGKTMCILGNQGMYDNNIDTPVYSHFEENGASSLKIYFFDGNISLYDPQMTWYYIIRVYS